MSISITYYIGTKKHREVQVYKHSIPTPDNWKDMKSHERDEYVAEKFMDYLDWSYEEE